MTICSKPAGSSRFHVMLLLVMWLSVLLAGWPSNTVASERLQLRSVTFEVPQGFSIARKIRDQEYELTSSNGEMQLWARWWLPDEPLLGFPDIVAHETRTVAGNKALFIHVEAAGQRSFTMAFTEVDEQGEQFLLQLHADSGAVSEQRQKQVFDKLIASVVDDRPKQAASGQKEAIAVSGAGSSGPSALFDGFRLSLPHGWQAVAPEEEIQQVRQRIFVSAQKDRLVWVGIGEAGSQKDALTVIDEFAELLYGEYLVIKSIDKEGYVDIAGAPSHAVRYTANVFPVAGIELPFKRAQGHVYRAGTSKQAFLIVTIEAKETSLEQSAELERIAASFTYADNAGHAALSDTSASSPAPDGKDAGANARWLEIIRQQLGEDCFMPDLTQWSHPTRQIMKERDVGIDWLALCRNRTYPIFGVQLKYDPRTSTASFFTPFYDEMLTANGNWAFLLVETRDGTSVHVARQGKRDIEVDVGEWPLPKGPAGNDAISDIASVPGQPVRGTDTALSSVGLASDDTLPLVRDGVTDFTTIPPRDGEYVLFDGRTIDSNWTQLADAKIAFEDAARITADGLSIDVPDGSGWGIIGLESALPVVWLDQLEEGASRSVTFRIDTRRSNSFVLGLRYGRDTLSLAWMRDKDGTRLRVLNGQNNRHNHSDVLWDQPAPSIMPKEVTFIVRSGQVEITAEGLETQIVDWQGAQQGNGLDVIAHPQPNAGKTRGQLTVHQIVMSVTAPGKTVWLAPSDDPASPPLNELFSATKSRGWLVEPWSSDKGQQQAPCTLDATGFHVNATRAEVRKLGQGCKIRSEQPAYSMGTRIDHGSLALFFDFDPVATTNFRIVLSRHKQGENWLRYGGTCFVDLLKQPEGQPFLNFWCGGADRWRRTVPPSWLLSHWTGRLTVRLEATRSCVELSGGPAICIPYTPSREPLIYVLAPDYRHKTSAHFALKGISAQWMPRLAGSPAERWRFLDDADFDPQAFIDETISEMKEFDQ